MFFHFLPRGDARLGQPVPKTGRSVGDDREACQFAKRERPDNRSGLFTHAAPENERSDNVMRLTNPRFANSPHYGGQRDKTLANHYFAASAASIASVTSGESGVALESKRLRILPSLPITNLLKFHLMLPGKGDCSPARLT